MAHPPLRLRRQDGGAEGDLRAMGRAGDPRQGPDADPLQAGHHRQRAARLQFPAVRAAVGGHARRAVLRARRRRSTISAIRCASRSSAISPPFIVHYGGASSSSASISPRTSSEAVLLERFCPQRHRDARWRPRRSPSRRSPAPGSISALGYPPCDLCLEQRYAYYAGVPLAAWSRRLARGGAPRCCSRSVWRCSR